MARIIGIDLSPSSTRTAVWDANRREPVIIPSRAGNWSTPALLSFAGGRVCAGEDAEPCLLSDPEKTIYPLSPAADARLPVRVEGQDLDWTMLAACLLYHLRQCAEAWLGEPVFDVVITCPVHYGQVQRNRLRNAARTAGLNVHRMLARSSAAGVFDGWRNVPAGAILNVVVCHVDDDAMEASTILASLESTVMSSASDAHPETFSFISPLVDWVNLYGIFCKKDGKIPSELMSSARHAIEQLAVADTAKIELPGPKSTSLEIPRSKYEQLSRPMLARVLSCVEEAVEEVLDTMGVRWEDYSGILLSGSCARQPMLRKELQRLYEQKSLVSEPAVLVSHQPELDAALGCALLASSCAPIGIPPESALSDRQLAQARHLREAPPADDITLYDVLSHTLGVELADHRFYPVVRKNTPLPCQTELTFSNAENATQMMASIFEGEAQTVLDNRKVGDLIFSVTPLPAGQHSIQVRFTADLTGELSFDCTDLRLGEALDFTMTPDLDMDEEEITRRRQQIEALWAEPPPPKPQTAAAAAGDPLEKFRQLTASIPPEWQDTWQQCLSLLPNQTPERKTILLQALDHFAAALQGADAGGIDLAGFALQDALLAVMF